MKKKINRHEISIFLTERHAESYKNYLNFTNFRVINFAKTAKPRFLSIRCGFFLLKSAKICRPKLLLLFFHQVWCICKQCAG